MTNIFSSSHISEDSAELRTQEKEENVEVWISTKFIVEEIQKVVDFCIYFYIISKYKMLWYEYFCGQQTRQGNVSANPFLSLINGLGIFGSGVLGALSALAQKEKATTEATMESVSRYAFF